jgi:ubiquitin fusion degradation protein 1
MMFGSFGGGSSQGFNAQYHCFSFGMSGRDTSPPEQGDKILLPSSALESLARMEVEWPLLFEIKNETMGNKKTHCGVLEFAAEEGRCYVPYRMMRLLDLEEGSLVNIRNVSLPKATYIKFRARSLDFLEIKNHRAMLEVTLRNYTCLTKDDIISVDFAGREYELDVREVKPVHPSGGVSIVETNAETDFDEPLGYTESLKTAAAEAAAQKSDAAPAERKEQTAKKVSSVEETKPSFTAFSGTARRIDDKEVKKSDSGEKEDRTSSSLEPSRTESETSTTSFSRKSIIGNKFAKKSNSRSAFGGVARKLS